MSRKHRVPRGRFVWYELLTSDPTAASDFYSKLIGWEARASSNDPSYREWVNAGTPIGGLMALPDDAKSMGAPPSWIGHIATPNVGKTAEQASKLGAKVLREPTEVPDVGKFAVLADPQGAVFAIFQPEGDTAAGHEQPQAGEVSWHELATTNAEAGFAFYTALFDWEIKQDTDMGEMGVYHMFGLEGKASPMGGIFTKPPEMPVAAWLYYVKVGDVKETAKQVKKLGGKVLNGPMEVPGGDMIVQCMDPQGAATAFHCGSS